jgi:hypothetical protein
MSKVVQESRMKAALDLLLEGDVDLSYSSGEPGLTIILA